MTDTNNATDIQTTSPAPTPAPSRLEMALNAITPVAPPGAPTAPPVTEDVGIHAKALALAQRKEREAFEAKNEAKKLAAELEQLKQSQESRKKLNPLEVLKAEYGLDYAGLTQAIIDNKFGTKTPEQEALSEHQKELQALKSKIDSYEQEKLTAQQAEIQSQNLTYIGEQITTGNYPVLATLPGHNKAILDRVTSQFNETGEEPDLETILAEYEAAAKSDVDAILASDKVLQNFLADEANKQRVLNLLGLSKNPTQRVVPAALPHTRATDPGPRSTPTRVATPKGRFELALSALETHK